MRFFYFLFFVEYKSLNFCGLTCPSPWEASPAIQKKLGHPGQLPANEPGNQAT